MHIPARRRGVRLRLTALMGVLLLSSAANAQSGYGTLTQEAKLKAAYVLNFLRFTTWPRAVRSAPLTVCVVAATDTEAGIDVSVAGKKVAERTVAVRNVALTEPLSDCDVLYVGDRVLPAALTADLTARPT